MTQKSWSFYQLSDGTFTGRRILTSRTEMVEANTPPDCAAIAGRYNPQTQRVDLETGRVVAYEAPPDARHLSDRAQAHIAALEEKQKRPVRELLLDPANSEARLRLAEIESQIAELRKVLQD